MLLFEFFPAFVALVSVIVGVLLWMADRRARSGPNPEAPRRRVPPPNAGREGDDDRGMGRPSMSA